jgi:hypothetical protein
MRDSVCVALRLPNLYGPRAKSGWSFWIKGLRFGGVEMPKGPQGEKRPGDVVSSAVMVGRIATGEVAEDLNKARVERARAGGVSRSELLTPERRSEIASRAAATRHGKREAEMSDTNCGTLVRRYKAEGHTNAVDIKFFLRNKQEATEETVLTEWDALDAALKAGRVSPLGLGELRWKD